MDTKDKLILDAACGSGYKTLTLAEANPGAKIVAIDISEISLNLAKQRLAHHGFNNVEFYLMSLEELPSLGIKFDYINNDEMLYLMPDISVGLQSMKAVLKPEGIIRTNLHSYYQRFHHYRAQSLFKMMGLMDENPTEMEVDIVRDIFKSLKDSVKLKTFLWNPNHENDIEFFMMNYLFQGDQGFTVPQMFQALNEVGLEFINMIDWRGWNLDDLFNDPDNLPTFLALSIPEATPEEKLSIFELLHPIHRLLDFWCGHCDVVKDVISIEDLTDEDWQNVKIYLHPQLKTDEFKEALNQSIQQFQQLTISKYLPIKGQSAIVIDSIIAACLLLPLLESEQSMAFLTKRWQMLHPVNPITLEEITEQKAWETMKRAVITIEDFGYLLVDR
jgi:SAM-dependent methyltransferase